MSETIKTTNIYHDLRAKNANVNQFKFGDKVKVTGWFFAGQVWIIDDKRDYLPANNPNPGDPEIVLSYQVLVQYQIDSHMSEKIEPQRSQTSREIEAKYLELITD